MRLHYFIYSLLVALLVIMLQWVSNQPSNIAEHTDSSLFHTKSGIINANDYIAKGDDVTTVNKLFPIDSGIINVWDYGAKGDGVTDDTQAIQTAIKSDSRGYGNQRTIYFPNGTYLVSEPLEWRDSNGNWLPYLNFQGQSRTNTIIKLKDDAPGYSDLNAPKAVIVTASQNSSSDGGGNQAFFNSIYNLTVDTGSNPGVIGIDYITNNKGAIRDVTIRGQGSIGLSLSRAWPGPCFIKNVRIEGFNYGIASRFHYQYGITFENITLNNQKVVGIINDNNVLSIHSLTSINSVPVIKNSEGAGLITLLDGNFIGGSSSVSAIENKGELYARNIKTKGYQSAINNKETVVPGTSVSEFASNPVLNLFPSHRKSLKLPIQNAPDFNEDVNQWVSVTDFGAKPNDSVDDAAAIQAAIDSGKSTIYFPTGAYNISSTIHVHGNVRKIVGMDSFIDPMPSMPPPDPSLRYEPGTYSAVFVERLNVNGWREHASPQTLVLRDCGHGNYRGAKGAGSLFGENVMIGKWQFEPGQKVWLRQLNTEFTKATRVVNNGAKLWILGLKTEDPHTVIETKGGGQTEVLGGLIYPVISVPATDVAFVNNESQVSLIYVTAADRSEDQDYTIHVQETKDGLTKTLIKSVIPNRGPGSFVMFSD